jgi:hypothetical protein
MMVIQPTAMVAVTAANKTIFTSVPLLASLAPSVAVTALSKVPKAVTTPTITLETDAAPFATLRGTFS